MKSIALILLLTFCGTSSAEISKITVNKAWKRITKAGSFTRIPITYEKDTEPNAWVKSEGDGSFSVHVTKGLMRALDTEDEIAGVLGHELAHIRLGHHEAENLTAVMRPVGINTELYGQAASVRNSEASFTMTQEFEADDYGTALLRKARYSPRGIYDALTKVEAKSRGSRRNGFTSGSVSRERLANAAEAAGISTNMKANSLIGMNDIADTMLGK